MFLGVALDQLEAYSTAGKVIEGIVAILSLGVEHCHGIGKFLIRQMVVADNHIYTQTFCVVHFLDSLDAAVQCNDQGAVVIPCSIYALVGNAVAFIISIGNIIFHAVGEAFHK